MFLNFNRLLKIFSNKTKNKRVLDVEESLSENIDRSYEELQFESDVQEKKECKSSNVGSKNIVVECVDELEELYKQFDGHISDKEVAKAEFERKEKFDRVVEKKKCVKKKKTFDGIRVNKCIDSRVDKNGLPVISASDDLYVLFNDADFNSNNLNGQFDEDVSTAKKSSFHSNRNKQKSFKKKNNFDKNGLLLLDKQENLFSKFKDDLFDDGDIDNIQQGITEEDDFASLLEKSFAGKNKTSILREKDDNHYYAKPIPLNKLLKRYPEPQRQLDLHGFIAREADKAAERFIKNASCEGVYTVRIIVGKGLHSEGEAVLPDVIENRIIFLKKLGVVLTFKWENGKKKKSGAVIVYLDMSENKIQ